MKSLATYVLQEGMFYKDMWKKITKGNFVANILAFEEPSEEYGIDGGKISKLQIYNKKTGDWLCNYDRGWDIEPTKDVKSFYDEILKKYN